MDFKNKLGTVDAHNLNLNFKPDNTDSHNIILNFEHVADGSTNLNFGDDVSAIIDTVLDTEFSFEVTAVYADIVKLLYYPYRIRKKLEIIHRLSRSTILYAYV